MYKAAASWTVVNRVGSFLRPLFIFYSLSIFTEHFFLKFNLYRFHDILFSGGTVRWDREAGQ